ncbi:CRISPR-associated protein Csm2 [Pelistega indica]|uniref:CRISPR system Cms protein Csm2 n=1 Tax=Pelistega indica TaxID=1414851 RepID=V8G871_9BURK|nr:type III-A CRISPR-associated protein Csm2 [Pelistega indica]ETD72729.1 CRISPR-associated protein Csm2 [Pelistega indica]
MMDVKDIKLKTPLARDLFSDVAKRVADSLQVMKKNGDVDENCNKSTQLRKFYDELLMWRDKVYRAKDKKEEFRKVEPFIQMMQAKVAYSRVRGHVSGEFETFFNHLIVQINDVESLDNAKLFFEAVLGFRKSKN